MCVCVILQNASVGYIEQMSVSARVVNGMNGDDGNDGN